MSILKVITTFALTLVLSSLLMITVAAQQKRQTPVKAPPKPVATATPAQVPTFDTLLGTDCYKIYVEVRGVGQLIRSNTANEVLEPVMKLAAPSKEFKTIVKWLNTHADDVMTSRMFVAAWPTARELPEALVAIEFASAEEAAKFRPQLDGFLPKVLPAPEAEKPVESVDGLGTGAKPNSSQTVTPQPSPEKPKESTPPKPNYYLTTVGSLILVTPTPLTLKKLRPAGSKLLAEDINFRMTRNRFSTEAIFAFLDVKGMEQESQREIEAAKQAGPGPKKDKIVEDDSKKDEEKEGLKVAVDEVAKQESTSDVVTTETKVEPPANPLLNAL